MSCNLTEAQFVKSDVNIARCSMQFIASSGEYYLTGTLMRIE